MATSLKTESEGFSAAPATSVETRRARGAPVWLWSALVLLVGGMLTLAWALHAHRQLEASRIAELARKADASLEVVHEQLKACELLVRAMQSVFGAAPAIDADEFDRLYRRLHPRERFPSLQAIVYAPRQAGPDGERFPTQLVQPLAGNERVVGFDAARQPPNLAAIRASRDEDRVRLSGPFRLRQFEDQDARVDGVTMRAPVYLPGAIPRTVAERRARFAGSLAVSFRVGTLIEDALAADRRDSLHVRVSDVHDGSPVLLYDSHPAEEAQADAPRAMRELAFGGRTWRLDMVPRGQASGAALWWPWLWPGLLASLLLAALVHLSINQRRRAAALAHDMTHRYRESEERFRALNDLLPALVLLARCDDTRIVYANQAARVRLGEGVGETTLPALFEDEEFRAELESGCYPGCSNAEAVLRSANGDRFWASVSISRVTMGTDLHLLLVASDVSEQRQLTELLSYQASHDALTELYNRREFERRVERALAAIAAGAPPAALLYIDLDQFKLINDTSGHIAGDHLLTQLASMMREQLRGGDVLARLGGDEFGVLATSVQDRAGARLVAERLRERIDGYVFVWEQRTYTISASIGGVMLDDPTVTLKDLFAHADTACYQAKENGRNRVQFFSAQDDDTTRRRSEMEWATRLRWAVDEKRLLLNYQEVWPLRGDDGGPSVELLVRFRDESGALVMPGAFIPAAERYGLMPMIDRWVVETAMANFDALHPSGRALKLVTINLSGASLEDDAMAAHIAEAMARHGVDPARVCFEVTETVAVRNVTQVSRFIGRLRDAGCRIALDDFGAGMSSFGYLKNLPVDIIKIDGSFIRDLIHDPMSLAIVRAVTDIGHQRGLQVVAEWVDSQEIVEALRPIGVDYAQGFALHRPEPVMFQRVATAS